MQLRHESPLQESSSKHASQTYCQQIRDVKQRKFEGANPKTAHAGDQELFPPWLF